MLQIRQLEKIIEGRSILSIEQLDVNAGEIVAVIGPVSSGKTLLIRLLCGTVMPSGGKVLLDEQDVHQVAAARARVGVLFEEDLLYKRLSAQGNLEFYCQMHRLPKSRAAEMLAQVGLSDQVRKPARKLSPSAQRRLAFARALISKPPVFLLDQPILRTATEEASTNLTLQELEARLVGRGFFKAHRAYLVNLQHIKAVIQFTRNSYTLQLNDSQETMIPLSKQSEKDLQNLLGY